MNKIKTEKLVSKTLQKLKKIDGLYPYVDKIVKNLILNNYNFYFVGGAIRDILISIFNNTKLKEIHDVDIVVETNEYNKIVELVQKIFYTEKNIHIKTYPQFLTISIFVSSKNKIKRIDLSIPRKEEYPYPASLPKVSIGTIFDDVYRRDFSVNAICLRYDHENKIYSFYDPFGGIKDIIEKKIKVLHDKSFIDDPTRILRGIRFAALLKFKFSQDTEKLIKEAIKKNIFACLSETRLNSEFVNILKKGENLKQLAELLKKYKIDDCYKSIKELVRKFLIYANKIELRKIKDNKVKFYLRLLFLLEKTFGKVGLLETNKLSVFKECLVKLNITKEERQPIYDAVKIFAYGETKKLPKWIKIYSQVFKRKIIKLPIKPAKLLSLGVPKQKIKDVVLYVLSHKLKHLSNEKIKSIALKL